MHKLVIYYINQGGGSYNILSATVSHILYFRILSLFLAPTSKSRNLDFSQSFRRKISYISYDCDSSDMSVGNVVPSRILLQKILFKLRVKVGTVVTVVTVVTVEIVMTVVTVKIVSSLEDYLVVLIRTVVTVVTDVTRTL